MAVLVAGCGQDDEPDPVTGSGPGEGMGGSVGFELVATDQLSVSPDGSQVLADCWNGICRWDVASGALELVPDRGSVAVAPDWSTVAVVGDDGAVVLEDLETGETVVTLAADPGADGLAGSAVTAVAYSPDGSLVAAATLGSGGAGGVRVWSVSDAAEEVSFETVGEVHRLAFAPDGNQIASAGNGPVEVHELTSGRAEELESGEGGTVAWSADGASLAGTGPDGQPVVWGTATWEQRAELPGVRLHEAAFAPDSDVLALTALDETAVTLWSTGGTQDDRELTGHTSAPGALAWSPEGDALFSVSADEGVLAWTPGPTPTPRPAPFEIPQGR
ncbi:MAG: hypothetical protein LH477_16020 [Nocardioides sp.]|nr:hypothetical protein [Nocardioides sp.]